MDLRTVQMNYLQGSSGDGDTEDRLTDMGGEARVGDEDGMNGEKGLEPRTRHAWNRWPGVC